MTISFLGYAAGSVMLAGLSSIFTDANSLSFACIFLMVIGSFLNFVIMKEPPRYYFRKGRISDGFRVLHQIAQKNATGLSEDNILQLMNYPASPNDSNNPFKSKIVKDVKVLSDSKEKKSIFRLLLTRDCISQMIRLTSISILLYIVFYVSSVSISDNLGLEKIQYNELVMGIAQMVGYATMIPILPKIKRVKFTMWTLVSIFVIGAILLSITFFKMDREGGLFHGTPY